MQISLYFIFNLYFNSNSLYLNNLIGLNYWFLNFIFVVTLIMFIQKLSSMYTLYFSFALYIYCYYQQYFFNFFEYKQLIKTLWVGTINIHPILLYLSIIFLYFFIYQLLTNTFYQKCLFSLPTILSCSILALVLGGLWGLQSLTWGYLWVNDCIEWVLFFLNLILVFLIHKNNNSNYITIYSVSIIFIITMLFLIRLNIITTRHSFFSSNNLSFSLICSQIILIFFISQKFFIKTQIKSKLKILTIAILIFYLTNSKLIYIQWSSKYIYTKLLLYFFIKSKIFIKYIKQFLIHFMFFIIFIIWSLIYTSFLLNIFLINKLQNNLIIYYKTIQLSFTNYIHSYSIVEVLEIVNFSINIIVNIHYTILNTIHIMLIYNIFVVIIIFILYYVCLIKGLNLDFFIKKKHIFKNRIKTKFTFKTYQKSLTHHIYTVKNCRLDLVSIRLFKKLLRRKFIKAKTRFFKPKYWLLLLPNYLLTQKSKNSRMGAGVGKLVRLTCILYSGKSFIKTWYYTQTYLKFITQYMHYKIPQKFLIKNVTNKKI